MVVERIGYTDETVWLDRQHTRGFAPVSRRAWEHHIGSYQVCEKWLKDRTGLLLAEADVRRYREIVAAISLTVELVAKIDVVIEAAGGWPGAFAGEAAL
jgi:NAD(P)-dependent dehydrogenase (short-subunit alcohol dehydrogenase family)